MRHSTRSAIHGLAVVMLTATGAAATPQTRPLGAYPPITASERWISAESTGGDAVRSVTLITGDRVLVSPAGNAQAVRMEPAAGRERVGFVNAQVRGEHLVVPTDAVPLLASGLLDPRLFDVAGLLAQGYDDAARSTLPLILRQPADSPAASPAAPPAARTFAARPGVRRVRTLSSIDGTAVTAAKADLPALWGTLSSRGAGGVSRVWLDAKSRPILDLSVPQIGAPAAWQAGYTGRGVKVAVLDSGYDPKHPDLRRAVKATANFTDAVDVTDTDGHGTHVASTVAGSGAASGGRFRGVAPDAELLIGKVCQGGGCADSAVIAGMQWATEQGARVVNLSLGRGDTEDTDPLEEAVETLTATTGTLFVVAAGNAGPFDHSLASPATADASLAVASVSQQDALSAFSSRGPRAGDEGVKPDLAAPGEGIVAARAAGTLPDEAEANRFYARLSGTSMAAPHVTGAAALLAQEHPGWRAAELKAALVASAKPLSAGAFEVGSGRVDVAAAIRETLSTSPVSLGFGFASWPHEDDAAVTRTVQYHNSGRTPLTLQLALSAAGSGGAAPAGMFALSAHRLTVPAGGSASVSVTVDTAVPAADGNYEGVLTATSDSGPDSGPVARTALGVVREEESYDHHLRALDRTGAPAPGALVELIDLDSGKGLIVALPEDGSDLRLRKGRYTVMAFVDTPRGDDPRDRDRTIAVLPNTALGATRDLVLDARDARPVQAVPPQESARLVLGVVGTAQTLGGLTNQFTMSDPGGVDVAGPRNLYVTPTPTTDAPGFTFYVQTSWAQPRDGRFGGSPYVYHLMYPVRGGVPAEPTFRVDTADLAAVRTTFAANAEGTFGAQVVTPTAFDQVIGSPPLLVDPLPLTRTVYYTAPNMSWSSRFEQYANPDGNPMGLQAVHLAPGRSYAAGQTDTEEWNRGVFGPAFPGPGAAFVSRKKDKVSVTVPTFSDDVADHFGFVLASGSTQLYRNGRTIDANTSPGTGTFYVPRSPATYRLVTTATHPIALSRLSTEFTGEWTFRSRHLDDETTVALAVTSVKYTPVLDLDNRAPAGGRFEIPVSVQQQVPGSRPGTFKSLVIDASYDDGQSWHRVGLRRDASGWTAVLTHPAASAGTGFVSLRAAAVDSDGNTTRQTIIRAYQLR